MSEKTDRGPDGALTEIRMARPGEAGDLASHVALHVTESGRDGSPVFALARTVQREDLQQRAIDRWTRGLDEPLWGRAWLLWANKPRRVVGHLELIGGRVPAELHRAVLAMGIQRAFTGQGHGPRLIETAVRWARTEARLAWIDLGVFTNNEPARKLYERMGFVEQGRRRDAFRVDDGLSIDDIHMALAL